MPVTFFPHDEDIAVGTLKDRIEVLMEAAERYKAIILDAGTAIVFADDANKRVVPREIKVAFNWQELSKILQEVRSLPEGNASAKATKADSLMRLSEVYEVLRGAKMPKLEAIRMSLSTEATQLRPAGSVSPNPK